MKNWICPVEYLDEDIRDVVRVLYENDMKPYMSCSGSYKDHEKKSVIPQAACVEMLDSELTREFMATLIGDERFKCSISKRNACVFYDNQLPVGFRFKIEFENICGDVSKDLRDVLQEVVLGKRKPSIDDRNKIDAVCELLDVFDVSRGNEIAFCFNDEMIDTDKPDEPNYSITVKDERNFEMVRNNFGKNLSGFIQNEHESRFFGNDYITMLAFLKKIGIEYSQIPILKSGEKTRHIVDKNRIDKFMASYSEKAELAKLELEAKQNQNLLGTQENIDLEDLLSFFQGGNNDDGAR